MDSPRIAAGAVAGALVSIVAGFLPFVSLVAPLLGGTVAGAVAATARRGRPARDGAAGGAEMGVLLAVLGAVAYLLGPSLPEFPIAVVLGPWARAFALGDFGNGAVVVLVSTLLLVVVGTVGGLVGGVLVGWATGGGGTEGR